MLLPLPGGKPPRRVITSNRTAWTSASDTWCRIPSWLMYPTRYSPGSAPARPGATLSAAVMPTILRHQPPPIPGSDSQGNSDFRKITRNLSLTFATFGDTGQLRSAPATTPSTSAESPARRPYGPSSAYSSASEPREPSCDMPKRSGNIPAPCVSDIEPMSNRKSGDGGSPPASASWPRGQRAAHRFGHRPTPACPAVTAVAANTEASAAPIRLPGRTLTSIPVPSARRTKYPARTAWPAPARPLSAATSAATRRPPPPDRHPGPSARRVPPRLIPTSRQSGRTTTSRESSADPERREPPNRAHPLEP